MKTLLISRHYFLFTLIIALISIFACSDDKPTEPEKHNDDIPILASATIGPDGGELKTDEFSLTVPVGSFKSDIEISLSITEGFDFFDENAVSKAFIIKGIPSDFSSTLRMAIKYTGPLSDSSYIALTSTKDEFFLHDSIYDFKLFSVKDSSGFLVTTFKNDFSSYLFSANKVSDAPEPLILGQSVTSLKIWKGDYFYLEGPEYLGNQGQEYVESMNNIFLILKDTLGFDFKYNNTLTRYNLLYTEDFNSLNKYIMIPFVVHAGKTNNQSYLYVQSFDNADSARVRILIDKNLIYSAASNRAKLNMSFWLLNHLVPQTYNENQLSSKQELLEAITWWMESYMNINNPPSIFAGNMISLFDGFDNDGISPGLSSLLQYLVNFQNYDKGNFGKVFEDSHHNNKNHFFSLITRIDSLVMNWFPDYYEKLFAGRLFDVDGSLFIESNTSETWSIKSDSDTSFTFSANYKDLSVKRILIELSHEFENESTSLNLDAYKSSAANNDGVATLVFGVDNNNNLEHLITGRAEEVEIQNLKGFYKNGTRKFLVVVVNCINNGIDYTGKTEIDLVAKIQSDKEVLEFNTCYSDVYVKGRYNYVSPDTNYTGNDALINLGAIYKGSFSNNTFSASYFNTVGPNLTITGSIEAVLDEQQTSIVNFNWNESHVNSVYQWTKTKALSAQNIPMSSSSDSRMTFVVIGETVVEQIITLRDEQSSLEGLNYVIQNFWSESDSYIKVDFYTGD